MPAGTTPASWVSQYKARASLLSAALPANVYLSTVMMYNASTVLLRLAHLYEVGIGPKFGPCVSHCLCVQTGEHPTLSQNVSVALATVFEGYTIVSATEMTLTAAQPLTAVAPVTYIGADGSNVTLPVRGCRDPLPYVFTF